MLKRRFVATLPSRRFVATLYYAFCIFAPSALRRAPLACRSVFQFSRRKFSSEIYNIDVPLRIV